MTELAVQNEPSAQPLAQRLQKPMADIGPALGLMAVVLVVWEFAIRAFKVPTFVLPAPTAIVQSLIDSRVQLLSATRFTAAEVLLGFVLAAATGIVVALVIVRFERFGRALYPLIVLFQSSSYGSVTISRQKSC